METEKIERVPLGDIKVHPGLQARDPSILSTTERMEQERQSEAHIADMAQLLRADRRAELVPIWVAEVDGRWLVTDGHHRLRAYKRAKRETIPARVKAMTWREAARESKLANLTHAKMEMRKAQKRNVLWHELADRADFGRRPLPDEIGLRTTAARFGVSRNTLRAMLRRLPEVDPKAYADDQRDAITGWPHWKAVATDKGRMYQAMGEGAREDWKARKCAEGLAKMRRTWGHDALIGGVGILITEAKDPEELSMAAELSDAMAEGWAEDGPADF